MYTRIGGSRSGFRHTEMYNRGRLQRPQAVNNEPDESSYMLRDKSTFYIILSVLNIINVKHTRGNNFLSTYGGQLAN